MLEEYIPFLEIIQPYLSPIVILVICAYILKSTGFWKSTMKRAKEAENTTNFIKTQAKFSFALIKMFQIIIVKYMIYFALYGFLIGNILIFAGFESAAIFGMVLILARIQMKTAQVSGIPYEEYDALKKKYFLTRKLLDEELNKKEVKK